jgi:transcription termination factor Rho
VLEILPDGFGFLRSPRPPTWPARTTSTSAPARSAASTCAPATRSKARSAHPKDGERYFALLKVDEINFEPPKRRKNKVLFENLTPLFPRKRS